MSKKITLIVWLMVLAAGIAFHLMNASREYDLPVSAGGILTRAIDQLRPEIQQPASHMSLIEFAKKAAGFEKEMRYLVLFQNNRELRPTGGFIGSFAEITLNEGQVETFDFHDSIQFDYRESRWVVTLPPEPLRDYLEIKNWQLRDSNWDPDFPTSARQALHFMRLQTDNEDFDGVIAITPRVLEQALEITGPIKIEDFPELNAQNAIDIIQQEVEQNFVDRGIDHKQRKTFLELTMRELMTRATEFDFMQKLRLATAAQKNLDAKDVQLYFKDGLLENFVKARHWSGEILTDETHDYLMVVDANLRSAKSDKYITRKLDYTVDFTEPDPRALLKLTYIHNTAKRDWATTDYRTYVRIYAPAQSTLISNHGALSEVRTYSEHGKTVFAGYLVVPVGQTRETTLEYSNPKLEELISGRDYEISIQKQAGVSEIPVTLTIKNALNSTRVDKFNLTEDSIRTLSN